MTDQNYCIVCGYSCFQNSKREFEKFIKYCLKNQQFIEKYVVFVHGKFQALGDWEGDLVKQMYDKFGNVEMYVGKITEEKRRYVIEETS